MDKKLFFDFDHINLYKKKQFVSGDYSNFLQYDDHIIFVLADGKGSGINANISAIFYATKLTKLLEGGFLLRSAAERVISEIQSSKLNNGLYCAFNICRLNLNGWGTIIGYEAPPPILSNSNGITPPVSVVHQFNDETFIQYDIKLNEGDKLFFFSDGVSQAGIGVTPPVKWDEEEIAKLLINEENSIQTILDGTLRITGHEVLDDITICSLSSRNATQLNIMTGPPLNRSYDEKIVNEFMNSKGLKIACGGTTLDIISRITGNIVNNIFIPESSVRLPEYCIEGVDLCTEGAITLNRLNNLLERNILRSDDVVLSKLLTLIEMSDIINIYHGTASNSGHNNSSFIESGILNRGQTVIGLESNLKKLGKIVSVIKY